MKTYLSSYGYYVVGLVNNDGKRKLMKVHRLIAFAFIDNPHNKPHINHINGIRNDNSIENLEWCTQSENMLHAFKIGNKKVSEKQILRVTAHGKTLIRSKNPAAKKYCNW